MRVLVALDKFKDSMSAGSACDAVVSAIAAARGGWVLDPCPLTDGGEGFCGILARAAGGTEHPVRVTGPRGAKVSAPVGLVPVGRIPERARALLGNPPAGRGAMAAVIEMATASGLAMLPASERDLTWASSMGTGELIAAAAAAQAAFIILGVGGSATHDLGLGALGALGVRCEGAAGESLNPLVPAEWAFLSRLVGRPRPLPPLFLACDVANPLLGERGALAVYGPQKGLKPLDAANLEAGTGRVAALVCRHFGRPPELAMEPGAGAAGGIGFGLMAALGAAIVPGFDLVSSWTDLDERISAADMVVTGEGRFDDSSLSGKGPGTVACRALAQGKLVHVFAGTIAVSQRVPGLIVHQITPPTMPLEEALAAAPALLSESVHQAFGEG
ncbi:MAG TPA: glycerate kinase [Opitutaceae bacterium]|jgi:glycerate kinase